MSDSGGNSTLRLSVVVDAATAAAERGLRSVAAAEKEVSSAAGATAKGGAAAADGLDKVEHSSTAVRRELIVLAHEMAVGNYSRFAGSMLVISERATNMGQIFAALRGLVTSPLVAIGALVGALASVVLAFAKGAAESDAFNKGIKLTGDYAGVTEGQYNTLISTIAAGDGKLAQSRAILEGLVGSGRFTSQSLGTVGAAAARLADNTGASADKVVGEFVKMTDGVAKWAAEANKSYHFLTGAQYEHIQELENQGRVQEAVQATAQALYDHLGGPAAQSLGLLERAWRAVGSAVNKVWDDMKSLGRDTTVDDRIAQLTEKLKEMRTVAMGRAGTREMSDAEATNHYQQHSRAGSTNSYTALQTELARLQAQQRQEQAAAQEKSRQDQLNQTVIDFQNQLKASKDGHQKMLDELEQYQAKYKSLVGRPGGISQEDYDKGQHNIESKDSATVQAHAAMVTSIAQANAELTKAEADRAKQQLDEQLKANEISIQQYYADRMAIEQKALAAERAARTTELGVTRATPAYTQADNDRRQAKEYELETQLKGLDEQRLALAQQMNSEREQSLKSLDKEIADFIAEGTRKGTDDSEAQIEAFATKARDILAKAAQSRPEMIPQLDQALQQGENQIRLDSQTKQIENLLADLQSKQITTQTQVQVGQLSPNAGRTQLQQQVQEAVEQLKAARAQLLEEAQDASNKNLDTTQITRALDEVQQKIDELSKSPMKALLQSWQATSQAMSQESVKFANSTADALTTLVTTGRLNFRSFTTEVLKDLAEIEIKASLAKLAGAFGGGGGMFSSLLGAFGLGGGSAGAAGAVGAGTTNYNVDSWAAAVFAADGGKINGPGTRTSDSISARLSDGEYVVRADAVARPGVEDLLDAINGGHIDSVKPIRRAAGGLVGSSPNSPGIDDSGFNFSMPVSMQLTAGDSGLTQSDAQQLQRKLVPQIHQITRAVMVSEMRPGGILEKVAPGAGSQ